jgi:HNH endonuclease/sigma-70-like protein
MTLAKTNNPRFSTAFRKASLEDRFHMSYRITATGCWEWFGAFHTTGYGTIGINKKHRLAHQVSWELHRGDRQGLCVLHVCDNRKCVNPEHLFLGTRKDNNKDRDSKGRGPRGERNWCTKLKADDIPVIRKMRVEGKTQQEIAKMYKVSQGTISQVVNRTTWVHIQ